jgi:hypothetical protein
MPEAWQWWHKRCKNLTADERECDSADATARIDLKQE